MTRFMEGSMIDPVVEADPVLGEIVRRLVATLTPARIYLFGSRARDDADDDSDYDEHEQIARWCPTRRRPLPQECLATHGSPSPPDPARVAECRAWLDRVKADLEAAAILLAADPPTGRQCSLSLPASR
jgi:hypothetical protein